MTTKDALTIKVEVALDEEFLGDILCTAVEGGTNYWAYSAVVERDGLDYKRVVFEDMEDEEVKIDIDLLAVAKGIERILTNVVPVRSDIRDSIMKGVMEQDAGFIDADGADCIVQAAGFNDIVYG